MNFNMVHTGSIRESLLPFMLEILNELSDFNMHFYGPNTFIVPNFNYVVKHGVVSHDTALLAQQNADVLISMGIIGNLFVASKIFEYMSTGKPVIHFFYDDFDPHIPYYNEYGNALCINVNDNVKQNIDKINAFMRKPAMHISYDDLSRIFYMCNPEYTFNVICNNLGISLNENNNKKILFITDAYSATMSANGICIKKVAEVFRERGYEVHIMGIKHYKEYKEEMIDGFFIHRISSNIYTKIVLYSRLHSKDWKGKAAFVLQKLLGIRTFLLLPFYPLREPLSCFRYIKAVKKLHNIFDFDLIVSSYVPIGALFAGNYLKKKNKVPFCTYFLDTFTDNILKHHFLNKSFMDCKGYKYERIFFESSDLILNLKSHEQNFMNVKYDRWRHKMKIVDIPHLKNRIAKSKN
jgi:hypothetical protein